MSKAIAKIKTKKIIAYQPAKDTTLEETPYIHKVCIECDIEYLTQFEIEIICPKCNPFIK